MAARSDTPALLFEEDNVILRIVYTAAGTCVIRVQELVEIGSADEAVPVCAGSPARQFFNGDGLGYFSGPNSDVFFVETRKRFTRRFETGFIFMKLRHGANFPDRNIGGDISQGGQLEGTTSSRFLDGIKTETTSAGLDLSFEIARNLFFKGGYALEKKSGEKMNVFTLSLALTLCFSNNDTSLETITLHVLCLHFPDFEHPL